MAQHETMFTLNRRKALQASVAALSGVAWGQVAAQSADSPIKIAVGFPPGGKPTTILIGLSADCAAT